MSGVTRRVAEPREQLVPPDGADGGIDPTDFPRTGRWAARGLLSGAQEEGERSPPPSGRFGARRREADRSRLGPASGSRAKNLADHPIGLAADSCRRRIRWCGRAGRAASVPRGRSCSRSAGHRRPSARGHGLGAGRRTAPAARGIPVDGRLPQAPPGELFARRRLGGLTTPACDRGGRHPTVAELTIDRLADVLEAWHTGAATGFREVSPAGADHDPRRSWVRWAQAENGPGHTPGGGRGARPGARSCGTS